MDKRKQQSSRIRERRLRRKYQRNIKIAIVVSLILGLAAGFAALQIHLPEVRMEAPAALPVAAQAVCALAITVCIQAIRNFLLTDETPQRELLIKPKNAEKAQDMVDERKHADNIM